MPPLHLFLAPSNLYQELRGGEKRLVLRPHSFLIPVTLLFALLLRLLTAFRFPNILWPDEIFQTLEPAHRLAFGYGTITWEYRDGVRSWALPGVLAGIMRLTSWLGEGSDGYLAGVKFCLCVLSLVPVLIAFRWGDRVGGKTAAILAAAFSSVWFELIYFAPKAFTEVVAAHLLLPGIYLGVHGKCWQPKIRFLFAGCLLGLALSLRIHLAPAILLAVLYIFYKQGRSSWLPLIGGILAPLFAIGLLDWFTWSYPFQSLFLNIWVNVVENKSHQYGISPWNEYLRYLVRGWGFAWIPIAVFIVLGARRSPLLAGLAAVIVLTHSALAHKEYRFIYPALPMLVLLAGLGVAEVIKFLRYRWLSSRIQAAIVLSCLLLAAMTSASLAQEFHHLKGYDTRNPLRQTYWEKSSESLKFLQDLSKEKEVCGLGLWKAPLVWTGGYTYLHKDVPIFLPDERDFAKLQPHFNYLIAKVSRDPKPPVEGLYHLQTCENDLCLYKKAGTCAPKPGYHVNQVFEIKAQ
jgi:GPI mannosyltransferase 3